MTVLADANRKTLVVSPYNTIGMVFNTGPYEFAKVVGECEDAKLLAPGLPASRFKIEQDRALAYLSRQMGFGNLPHAEPLAMEEDVDLFVFAGAWMRDVAELRRLKNWRKRSKLAVAYIFECWPSYTKDNAPHLKELCKFDLVVMSSAAVASVMSEQVGREIMALPYGVDTEVLSPLPHPPRRSIDIYAMGRRPKAQHPDLMRLAEADPDLFYMVDSGAGAFSVSDFQLHAQHRANVLKRTKIFPCYGPNAFQSGKSKEAQALEMTPLRFYEAAASGAFVIGDPPNSDEYREHFDWQDAYVYASGNGYDYASLVSELLAQPDRLAAASALAVKNSLTRHDWAHRWSHILEHLGLAAKPGLTNRRKRLTDLAEGAGTNEALRESWLLPGSKAQGSTAASEAETREDERPHTNITRAGSQLASHT